MDVDFALFETSTNFEQLLPVEETLFDGSYPVFLPEDFIRGAKSSRGGEVLTKIINNAYWLLSAQNIK